MSLSDLVMAMGFILLLILVHRDGPRSFPGNHGTQSIENYSLSSSNFSQQGYNELVTAEEAAEGVDSMCITYALVALLQLV